MTCWCIWKAAPHNMEEDTLILKMETANLYELQPTLTLILLFGGIRFLVRHRFHKRTRKGGSTGTLPQSLETHHNEFQLPADWLGFGWGYTTGKHTAKNRTKMFRQKTCVSLNCLGSIHDQNWWLHSYTSSKEGKPGADILKIKATAKLGMCL